MPNDALKAYARRIRELRRADANVSEPALAPAFQQLLIALLPTLDAVPDLIVSPEFNNPGVGRPDIALIAPGQPPRDRTTKFAFVELHEKATRRVAADFLRHLAEAVPYKVHTVLTDNGTHFTDAAGDSWTPEDIKAMRAQNQPFWCHAFEAACADLDVDHRLTKPRHPWTNGQVERMNRTIKDATVKRYHYDSHDQLRTHLADFVAAYNFGRRLKTLRGLTPYEAICKAWQNEPVRFTSNPHHQAPGPNI